MSIIAIDCGASFIKGSKFKGEDIVKSVVEKTPADNNPEKMELSVEIIKKIIRELSDDENEIHLGFSNEMHGFVLTDKNGKAVTKYMSWQNECASEKYENDTTYIDKLRSILDEKDIIYTGMPLKLGLPSVNLFYVIHNGELIENETYYFYTLGDYYIRVLTGVDPYIHETNAAGTGLYNVVGHCWNDNVINAICEGGKYNIIFPEVYEHQKALNACVGGQRMSVYPALGDQQAALLGAGVDKEYDVSFNFGTGAQISIVKREIELSNNYQIRPYFNGLYLKTVPHIPSGRALNVYFKFVKGILNDYVDASDNDIWDYINKQTKNNKKKHMTIDMSFFTNAVSNRTTGEIGEIAENDFTIGNLFDSVYEQMANNIENICIRLGIHTFERLMISGGILIKNEILRDYVLARFSNPYELVLAENETAKGIFKFVSEIVNENKSV